MPSEAPRVFTVREAADYLKIGRSYTEMLIASGELKSFKLGRLRRIPAEALEDFVAKKVNASRR